MNAKVFVLEPQREFSLRNAADFGKIEYVYGESEYRPSIWAADFVKHAMRRLEQQGFNPDRDFFVCTGHLVPIVMVACAVAAHSGMIKLLTYVATDGNYVARTIEG